MPPKMQEVSDATAERLVAIGKPIVEFANSFELATRAEYSTAAIHESVIITDITPVSCEVYDPMEAPKSPTVSPALKVELQAWEAAGLEGWTTELEGGDSVGPVQGNDR